MQYNELGRTKVQKQRIAVLSEAVGGDNRYTLSQAIVVEEHPKTTVMFIKGAIQIESFQHLKDLSEMLNKIVEEIENS